jgi:hypothetical protein
VLNQLPGGYRPLRKNVRRDVVLYFRTLAQLLEDKLLQTIQGAAACTSCLWLLLRDMRI